MVPGEGDCGRPCSLDRETVPHVARRDEVAGIERCLDACCDWSAAKVDFHSGLLIVAVHWVDSFIGSASSDDLSKIRGEGGG